MQALRLRKLVGCTEADRKAWVRIGVLVPAQPGAGAGVHADFDAANVVAALVAQRMKYLGITVKVYQTAFAQLHEDLRKRSEIEWSCLSVIMTPLKSYLIEAGRALPSEAIVIDLAPLCRILDLGGKGSSPQRELPFGLRVVV